MSFHDGIFNPQFKISPLPRRKYLLPLNRIYGLKPKSQFNFSPRLKRYFKATQLLSSEKTSDDLTQTYNLHKQEHPNCSILPAIKQELQKKHKNFPSISNFPTYQPPKLKSLTSKTPDPVVSFLNTLKVSKIHHSNRDSNN